MSEEMIDVLDEEDKFVRKASRGDVRKNALLHKTIHVVILNEKGKFFVQKRAANKDIWPRFYEVGVGETVIANEDYDEAAERGLREEIGINAKPQLLFETKFRSEENNANIRVYKCVIKEGVTFVDKEVSEGFFVSEEKLKGMVEGKDFTPDSVHVMKKYWGLKNAR